MCDAGRGLLLMLILDVYLYGWVSIRNLLNVSYVWCLTECGGYSVGKMLFFPLDVNSLHNFVPRVNNGRYSKFWDNTGTLKAVYPVKKVFKYFVRHVRGYLCYIRLVPGWPLWYSHFGTKVSDMQERCCKKCYKDRTDGQSMTSLRI